jgi:tRNA(Ile2) C34 agmatinyltransferase TiaS
MEKYTKEEIINAVKEELIEAYGSLSNTETPYLVLGILEMSFRRLNPLKDITKPKCFKCGHSTEGMPEDECINCFQKILI